MLKKTGIQVSEESLELLGTLFKKGAGKPNPSGAASYLVESFRGLYRQTLIKMNGTFTPEDLYLMLSVMNGTILTPTIAGQHILAGVEDGIALDSLDTSYGTDGPGLIAKIKTLSIPERAILELWLKGFWGQNGINGLSIEDYIKPLIPN